MSTRLRSLAQAGTAVSITGGLIRVLVTALVFVATLVVVGTIINQVPTPQVLTLLPGQIPMLCGVGMVLLTLFYVFDIEPAAYGLSLSRQWVTDFAGGVVLGVLFQGVSTAAILSTETGTIVSSWSTGVFTDPAVVGLAIVMTAIAFVIIALWEDFLFRGVLIREVVDGLASRGVPRPTATLSAVIVSALLFGALHVNAGAAGLSASVVVLQATIGGVYFGVAYVLTDSIALPIGIHFSTNLWTKVVFGQPESGYPTAFQLTRPFELSSDLILPLLLPSGMLIVAVFIWAYLTRGEVSELSLTQINDQ